MNLAAMASSGKPRPGFFPKADAVVLSCKPEPPPPRPQTVGPVYDPGNSDTPIGSWPNSGVDTCIYPPKTDAYAPASIPEKPTCSSDRYLRAFLAENERLRLSMLWYYTRDILQEAELLSGLQEKAYLAQESTGWEYVVIGILDVNFYVRLATVGLPLAILPRGETLCAHTVTQPPGSVFLLPNMLEDWRFQESPHVESGGLRAYAGAPLRLQNESGDCVCLGSLCVASPTGQLPLTKPQQHTLIRLADWVVADIIQCARARRQRERRRMAELLVTAQKDVDEARSEDPIVEILRLTYPEADITLQSPKDAHIEINGRDPILLSDLEDGLWEDVDYIDDFITHSNHLELPSTRVVRVIAARCETISGPSLVVVASKDFRRVFDDVDSWFVQTCASMLSQMWQKRLLGEVMKVKEKFLRGVSHQLRTPIHGILGSVELLAEELKVWSLRESVNRVSELIEVTQAASVGGPSVYINTIKTAGLDLISIVNNVITLNRWADIAMSERHYAPHNIDELEAELASGLLKATSSDTRYTASVFFNHDLSTSCETIQIDLGLLRDSLLPLIINAVQNTTQGVVVVTTSIQPASKQLVVDVEDTGCGIDPDHHQRIFDPYERVGMHSTGAGLGLTIASKFATLLQGSVELLSSEPDRGSHFRAVFQEVESVSSNSPPVLSTSEFDHLPSRFHSITPSPNSTGRTSACDHLTKLLAGRGFTSSDTPKNSFITFPFLPDLKHRRRLHAQIPPGHVAICLLPPWDVETSPEETSTNIVYVKGPFLTSTLNAALQEADRVLAAIKSSTAPLEMTDDLIPQSDAIDAASTPTQVITPSIFEGQPSPQPTDPAVAEEAIPALTAQSDSVASRKTDRIVPIISAPANPARPMALLVDDNVVNLRIMQMYCNKRGLPYLSAMDGKEAVEIFTKCQSASAAGGGAAIKLIFMDLQMPVCDGIEATQQIRALEKQNPWGDSTIFIVTGQDGPTDRTAAKSAGADDYFVKPVGMKVLDRNVNKYFPDFQVS